MMDDRVIPIAITNVAWQQYLNTVTELLGKSPSRGVDSCSAKLSDFAKYTASLAEFQMGQELDAKRILRTRGPWLQHTFYSFLILTSNTMILKVAEATDLSILSTKADTYRLALVSGTLDKWRDAVILFCDKSGSKRLRLIFNQIKRAFDQLGLQDVFFEFSLRDAGDGTFLLENKNS